jgi:YHS domain-containing protein
MKVIDPVCKMQIESAKAAATSEHKGKTIYFCSPHCKVAFDKEPQSYAES